MSICHYVCLYLLKSGYFNRLILVFVSICVCLKNYWFSDPLNCIHSCFIWFFCLLFHHILDQLVMFRFYIFRIRDPLLLALSICMYVCKKVKFYSSKFCFSNLLYIVLIPLCTLREKIVILWLSEIAIELEKF